MKRNFVKSAGSVKRPKVLFVDGVKLNWKVKSRFRIKIPNLAMVKVGHSLTPLTGGKHESNNEGKRDVRP